MRIALAIGIYIFGFILTAITGSFYMAKKSNDNIEEQSSFVFISSLVWPMVILSSLIAFFYQLPVRLIQVLIKKLRK